MEIIDEGKANRHVAVTSKWVICTKDVKITINHFWREGGGGTWRVRENLWLSW